MKFAFTYRSEFYAGKPVQASQNEYYIKDIEKLTLRLVEKYGEENDLRGRNLTTDNLYTSITLAQKLLQKNMTLVGTMRKNRKGIPKPLLSVDGREVESMVVIWEKEQHKISLTSYVTKTASGKKNVIVLSSQPVFPGVTKDGGKKKPQIIKFYDFSKGGTDIVDQRMDKFSTATKSKKWKRKVWSMILDASRVNAASIVALNLGKDPRKTNSFDFCWALGTALCIPFVQKRLETPGLQSELKEKMIFFLKQQNALPPRVEVENPRGVNIFPHPKSNTANR